MMRVWSTLLMVLFVMVVGAAAASADEPVTQKNEYVVTTINLMHTTPSELIHNFGWCGKNAETCRYCAPVQNAKPEASQPVSKPEDSAFLVRSITPVDFPEGIGQIAPFDLDSSIIVKGTPEQIEKLESIIGEVDYEHRHVAFDPNFIEVNAETMELLNEKLLSSAPKQGDGSLACIAVSKKQLAGVGIPLKMLEFSSRCPGLADDKLVATFTFSKSPQLSGSDDPGRLTDSDTNLQIMPTINTDGSVTVDLLIKACQQQKNSGSLVQAKLRLSKDDVILLFRNSSQKNVLVILVPKVMDVR